MSTNTTVQAPGSLRGDDRSYPGYRRVGIRLTEPVDPVLAQAREAVQRYPTFGRGLQQFDKAHLVMLAEQGIIPGEGARACLLALREMDAEGVEKVRAEVKGGVHGGEVYLVRRLGMEVGGLIHAGRSTWDLTRVSHRFALRERLLEVMDALNTYRRTLLSKAAEHVQTVMPYYTHGQQGQPTTFAHHLHAFVCAAERDYDRLESAYQRMNISPAGAAAGTASPFSTNRERVAEFLGFDSVSTNTRDSSYNYDHLWEMGATLSFLASGLGFLADEIILWMGNEFGLVQLADQYCVTSSIMTHKRNPTAAEEVQAVRTRIAGRVPTSYTAVELVDGAEQVVTALRLCSGMVETLKVDRGPMLSRTANSWAQSADLTAALVREKGLPWRMAHQIVGIMVRLAEEQGIEPQDATPALLDRAAVLFLGKPVSLSKENMAQAMDPKACLQARQVTGSPGPREMRRQLAASRRLLARHEERLQGRRQQLEEAARRLEQAIDAIVE